MSRIRVRRRPIPELSDELKASFWAKVNKTDSCWLWTGATSVGYGHIGFPPRSNASYLAHRVAYHLLVGPIPDMLVLDHLCNNPRCVNPAHLEPVTHRENHIRGIDYQLQREVLAYFKTAPDERALKMLAAVEHVVAARKIQMEVEGYE